MNLLRHNVSHLMMKNVKKIFNEKLEEKEVENIVDDETLLLYWDYYTLTKTLLLTHVFL